jgi:hypothetical protein
MSTEFNVAALAALLAVLAAPGVVSAQEGFGLGAAAVALSTLPSRATPCARDIDRAWVEVGAKIQARIGAGRIAPQSAIALLHRQPTPNSIAAAEENLGGRWLSMETAVTALARAREADRANDSGACEQAITEAQRAIVR